MREDDHQRLESISHVRKIVSHLQLCKFFDGLFQLFPWLPYQFAWISRDIYTRLGKRLRPSKIGFVFSDVGRRDGLDIFILCWWSTQWPIMKMWWSTAFTPGRGWQITSRIRTSWGIHYVENVANTTYSCGSSVPLSVKFYELTFGEKHCSLQSS